MRLYGFTLLMAIALLASIAESQSVKPVVECGQTNAFCGRGLNRKDCCAEYYCDIAPNDAYAICRKKETTVTPPQV